MPQENQSRAATLSVEQAAKVLGISTNGCYAAIHADEVPSIRLGRRLLVPRHGLEQLLGGPLPSEPEAPAGGDR